MYCLEENFLPKSKQVQKQAIVRLTSATTKGFNFDVYTDDLKETVKYLGTISKDHKEDSCTCMGNTMGLVCYHIKEAHKKMDGFW
jgi:hypothetical protein